MIASPLHQILDAARWAPSGDNTQPWRFEILAPDHVVVHGFDTRDHCVYDLDGRPSQLSIGAMLETLSIAASTFGMRADIERRLDVPDQTPTFDVRFRADASIAPSPLAAAIARRSVQRRPFSPRPLGAASKAALAASVDVGYELRWIERAAPKRRLAALLFANAGLRLTMQEAYHVHRDVIEWRSRYSSERVPDQALGADALTLVLMRWAMREWSRVRFLNRWLAGTWLPRLQMDLLPALLCGAHVAIVRCDAPASIDDHVDVGRQVQRMWLTAARLGLLHQPEITPLVFARYVRERVVFCASAESLDRARRLEVRARALLGDDMDRIVWLGRVGWAPEPRARSVRLPLTRLLRDPDTRA